MLRVRREVRARDRTGAPRGARTNGMPGTALFTTTILAPSASGVDPHTLAAFPEKITRPGTPAFWKKRNLSFLGSFLAGFVDGWLAERKVDSVGWKFQVDLRRAGSPLGGFIGVSCDWSSFVYQEAYVQHRVCGFLVRDHC